MKKEIALCTRTDVIGLDLVNRLVPMLLALGYKPIIIDSSTHRNRHCIMLTHVLIAETS